MKENKKLTTEKANEFINNIQSKQLVLNYKLDVNYKTYKRKIIKNSDDDFSVITYYIDSYKDHKILKSRIKFNKQKIRSYLDLCLSEKTFYNMEVIK